ncbi:MAG: hypothetical protein DCC58_07325 [Chloroflexi bacterium]|nr:MAG: hypothetical protein DCC58_07325 [Chloroflexota bacterium]
MGDLVVVGLAGRSRSDNWHALLAGRHVVARNRAVASATLPEAIAISTDWDEALNTTPPPDAIDLIVSDVLHLTQASDVAYLTPGLAALGDVVVARLLERGVRLQLSPGDLRVLPLVAGPHFVVDALELAEAEAREPFQGTLPLLDPTAAIVVSNWYGTLVPELAARRLARTGLTTQPMVPDANCFLCIPPQPVLEAKASLAALTHIVARLRRSDGCPWDRAQTPLSFLPSLTEETDELREAIEQGAADHIAEEMGDVLVNLLMQAQMAHERGTFHIADALSAATRKLVRRHPHVFAGAQAASADEVLAIWNAVKAAEKASAPQ